MEKIDSVLFHSNLKWSKEEYNTKMGQRRHLGSINSNKFVKCFMISPVVFALIIFISAVWLIYEVPYLLPAKPVPPPFNWHQNFSRNISSYIKMGIETTLLDLQEVCSSDIKVLFIVPSSVNNTKKREAIRKTWGSWVVDGIPNETNDFIEMSTLKKVEYNFNMKLVFMLGKDLWWENSEISNIILKEHSMYQDIVVEDFIDSYTNLTLKSIFILKWAKEKCKGVNFVMKADDDMFINVPNLLERLKNVKSPAMLGNLICNAHPISNRWSKWYAPSFMFTGKYPNYLSGTAYVISGDIIEKLLTSTIQTPYFHLEDVYLTGICAKKIGVKPSDIEGFSYLQRSFNPCIYSKVITSHDVSPANMIKMWNMLHNHSVLKRCKEISRKILNPSPGVKCVW